MGTEYGELLADFDLGFLNSSNNEVLTNAERIEKQKKAILIAKRKTIATDSLLKKYYAKKDALDLLEKTLFESKMECKQVCIEYRNAVEQIGILEENERKLQDANRDLEDRNALLDSQCSAFQSHAHQLQELVKAQEKKINNLEIESENDKLALKESERTKANLEKSESSLKDLIVTLKDILLGQGVLNPKIKSRLNKFSKKSDSIKFDDSECEDCDWINEDPDDDVILKETKEVTLVKITDTEDTHIKVHNEMERCAEISSSVDTGRGSSLASDSEKCFYSPDHVSNDSSIEIDPLKHRNQVRCQDAATSPIAFTLETERLSPIYTSEPIVSSMKKPCDIPMLPTNTIEGQHFSNHLQTQKECLEVNSRNVNDNCDDNEVSSILKEIRLHFDLVTPIPPTPSSSIMAKHNNIAHSECLEATKIREENKVLQSSVADLAKQVLEIKMMLSKNSGISVTNTCVKATPNIDSNNDNATAEDFDCDNYAPEVPQIETELESQLEVSDDEHDIDLAKIPSPQRSVIEETEIECNLPNKEVTKFAERIRFLDSSENNDVESVENVSLNVSDISKTCDIEINEVEEGKAKKKRIRRERITKLERMRLRLQPKSKIKTHLGPIKSKINTNLKPSSNTKQVNKTNSNSCNLNDKAVYEKALAVVAEIRAKKKQDQERVLRRRTILPRKVRASNSETIHESNSSKETPVNLKRDTRSSQRERLESSQCDERNDQVSNKSTRNHVKISSDANLLPPRITTRSRTKGIEDNNFEPRWNKTPIKRPSTEELTPESSSKRMLRSSLRTPNTSMELLSNSSTSDSYTNASKSNRVTTSYEDQEIFEVCDDNDEPNPMNQKETLSVKRCTENNTLKKDNSLCKIRKETPTVKPGSDKESSKKESILCKMIDKYGVRDFRKKHMKKIPDHMVQKVFKTITKGVERAINAESNDAKTEMNSLVEEIKSMDYKLFMIAFMKYLQDPDRKMELLSMTCTPPLPPMSKAEQVVLYILSQLNQHWPNITLINEVLQNIEYQIFRLNKTPDFSTIDTMSHLYAVLCRFSKAKNKLRLFMLDAMYCIGYKAVPLIRQCINVWMHVLPLPHMRSAKNPLVICLIYLLHFYKCEDKFKKVQEMRDILYRKYSYDLAEWNETKIIEQFRTSIMDIRDNKTELSILRVAIVIYAKRLGARWCEKNIIKNLLVPIITNENHPERIRRYCISLLGPLVRPFPPEMKVNSEIIMNQLIDMLDQNLSHGLKEATYTSLLYIHKHDHRRVTRALLDWKPDHKISPDLEQLLRIFVQDRPVGQWKEIIARHNS